MDNFLVQPEYIWTGLDNYQKVLGLNNEQLNKIKVILEGLFMQNRERFCNVFNAKIGKINEEYDKLGLPYLKEGKEAGYDDSHDPRYIKFIADSLKDDFEKENQTGYLKDLGWEILINQENGDFYAKCKYVKDCYFEVVLYPVKFNKDTGIYERCKLEEVEPA